jgi:hypothetical protein
VYPLDVPYIVMSPTCLRGIGWSALLGAIPCEDQAPCPARTGHGGANSRIPRHLADKSLVHVSPQGEEEQVSANEMTGLPLAYPYTVFIPPAFLQSCIIAQSDDG